MELTDDHLNAIADSCGKAIGFAFAAAMRDPESLRSNAGLLKFKEHLDILAMDDKFSPDVTLVINGLTEGIAAFTKATPNTAELI